MERRGEGDTATEISSLEWDSISTRQFVVEEGSEEGARSIALDNCVVMCVGFDRVAKTVAIASYDTESTIILHNRYHDPHLWTLREALSTVAPNVVLMEASADESLVVAMQEYTEASHEVRIVEQKKTAFQYRGTQGVLSLLRAKEDKESTSYAAWEATLCQLEQQERGVIHCLILFLKEHGANERVESPLVSLLLQQLQLENAFHMDMASYHNLGIFSSEHHPTATGRPKEGFSLFGLLNKTRSQLGAKMLKQWFRSPTSHISTLNDRLEHISFFLHPSNGMLLTELCDNLNGIKDVCKIMQRIYGKTAGLSDWKGLLVSLERISSIAKLSHLRGGTFAPLSETASLWCHELETMRSRIESTIDFSVKSSQHGIAIKRSVDKTLDQYKDMYGRIDEFLDAVAKEDVEKGVLPSECRTCSYVFMPQLGFLVRMKKYDCMSTLMESMEFQFEAEEDYFFKHARTRLLDDDIGDLPGLINDTEAAILRTLSTSVLKERKRVKRIADSVAYLDCILSLALGAAECDFRQPVYTQKAMIKIQGGFHPLQRVYVDQFIPNDIEFNVENAAFLLTGANNSGKTVFLRQVGIVVFLAHIGSYVPATAAYIGPCDGIYTSFEPNQLQHDQGSSFYSRCLRMSHILAHVTPQSLILVDEFGKGTTETDGTALCSAVLNYFSSVGCRVIASSHLLGCMDFLKSARPKHMEVALTGNDDIAFLYRIQDGISTKSFGVHCARMSKCPDLLCDRATSLIETMALQRGTGAVVSTYETSSESHALLEFFREWDAVPQDQRGMRLISEFIDKLDQ